MQPIRKHSGLGWMALATASALMASTCCVLPLVLVLAGIGGAWVASLAPLKPWTPVFVVLALGALGAAGWLVFFKQGGECAVDDGACSTTRPIMRRVFIACAVFIGILLLFPLFAPLFY